MELAGKWFNDDTISSGQAATMVGISKREFIETMGNFWRQFTKL